MSERQKTIVYFSIISIFFQFHSYGQDKFREGYIITLPEDTVYGLIDYKIASKSAEKCKFKSSADANTITYTPEQIAGYRFTPGKYYVARSVEIEGTTKKVFLEYLIDGIADIYFYRDENEDHYFIEKEKDKLTPLTIQSIEVVREGKTYKQSKEYYKGTLKYIFSDAPTLSDKIQVTDLNHADLIDIAEDYHSKVCDEYECIAYSRQKTPIQIRFGIMGGSSISQISFKNVEYLQRFMEVPFPSSTNITIGTFVKFRDPFLSERFSVQVEAWFGKNSYTTDELELSYSYLKIPALARYTSIHRKVRPTFALGPVATFLTDVETKRINRDQAASWLQDGRSLVGIEGAIGFDYFLNKRNSVFLEARYNINFGAHRNIYRGYTGTTHPFEKQDFFKSKITLLNIVTGISF